ncbi:MAG TPA: PEP/pyruvate-binding domain-containing protein [Microlunatus sp.]
MVADEIDIPTGDSGPRRVVVGLAGFGRHDVSAAGGKAANLGELVRAGLPVPPGFVVTTTAYREFVAANDLGDRIVALVPVVDAADASAYEAAARAIAGLFAAGSVPDPLVAAITGAYRDLGEPAVAVRSSATAEDLEGASFAGQQDTYLNVSGTDAVLHAVRRCWASLWTARAMAYRARQGIEPAEVSLAVVVQELVDAVSAGVMFTADPGTGRRDTVLISAAWGLGEAVVGGLVNTDQLTLVGPGLTVTDRRIADKAVQTVRTGTGTTEAGVPPEQRRAPVLDDAAARELAGLGRRIADHFGAPQDIEWVRDGTGELRIVQSRPITALPEPVGAVPTEWDVPIDHSMYVRASIVEQLPDPLTPLFAEVIDGAVTRSISALMNEILGRGAVRPGDVGLPTINGYAYYRYDYAAMARMLRSTPMAFRGAYGKRGVGGRERWETLSRPAYQAAVDHWRPQILTDLAAVELLDGVADLVEAGATYYTSVQTIIPIAATSEILLTGYYDAFVRRDGDPPASALLLGYDSEPIRAERSLWDLARWVRERPELADWLTVTSAADVAAELGLGGSGALTSAAAIPGAEEFVARFGQHLDAYGHAVYNLDFANPVPADDPAPLVDVIRLYLRDQFGDPYERQRRLQQKRDAATVVIRRRLDPLRRSTFDALLRRAQAIAPIREDALADVGLAWPQLRRMLAELGGRLVAADAVERPDDVYWCHRQEIEAALMSRRDLRPLVEQRRQLWRGQRRATPPQVLPAGTWLDRLGAMMPATTADQTGDVLTGSGASAGRVTGTARVLSGPADFAQLGPGEVLVASITTPAWTSLFARAGAVVTDIGGPLSHSSIVAREYGIPAVLGTAVATRRIVSGQQVTVDGDAGRVYLADPGAAVSPVAHRRLNRWLIAGGTVAAAAGAVTAAVVRHRHRP